MYVVEEIASSLPACGRLLSHVSRFRYNVTKFITNMDGAFGGCCGGQDEPARPVQSASHDGTDPPYLTFEARLKTFTSNVVRTGRLSRHSK